VEQSGVAGRVDAAGARAKWERSRILTVSALAKEYGRAGSGRFEQGPGLQIEAPIFNRNQGGISRAEAEIERAARQFIATRQRISAEVREAYLSGCAKPQAAENRKAAAPPAKVENAVKESELATVKLSPQAEARLGITTAPVTIERVAQTRTFAGEIVLPPDRTTSVMAPLNGALEASGTPPAVGTFVRKGQPLYRLTPFLAPERDLRVQIEREVVNAQTRVEAARARHKRAEQLLRDGAASEKAVEQAREELDLAGNDLKAARERLERYEKAPVNADVAVTIAAPRDGVIQKVSVNPGQTIASGSPLFEVANLSSVWIRVPVVEAALNALKPGLKDVEIDSTICASSTDYFPLGFDNRARISLTV
jgi:multidrug efflux pump subunit AcrA (membrane-fusion protein)